MLRDDNVFEGTLFFDRATGEFTFDSRTHKTTGAFHIPLEAPTVIIIHAGPGIEFMPTSLESPNPLPFSTMTPFLIPSNFLSRVEIDVIELPPRLGLLGFLLSVRLAQELDTVVGIQAPPFFITQGNNLAAQELRLSYNRFSGGFILSEEGNDTKNLPISIPAQRGMVIPRLSNGSAADNQAVSTLRVKLAPETAASGVVFAQQHPAVFTVTPGPQVTRVSDTEITITQDFTSGTGFGVSFGVQVPTGGNPPCTVYSPDPIIVDKTVGTNPGS